LSLTANEAITAARRTRRCRRTAHPWDLLRAILAENGGCAAFLYTPAGRNHGHELYEQARQRVDWFTTLKTTEDTRRDGPVEDGGPIISRAQIEEEIAAGMPRVLANQEFGCSFVSATPGAYFSKELEDADRAGRIRNVPWDPTLGVTIAWDLGISDAVAIVFAQTTGIEVRIIDYLEDTGQGLAYYAKRLGEKSYRYTEHILPHDADQREVGTGKMRLETLCAMSLGALRVLPNLPITDGIEQARQLLTRAYFDRDRCRPLLKSLEHYRTDWIESRKTFTLRPRHDWASAGADAFRYLALGCEPQPFAPGRPLTASPPQRHDIALGTAAVAPGPPHHPAAPCNAGDDPSTDCRPGYQYADTDVLALGERGREPVRCARARGGHRQV
jgi:phage terminase large subunit